VLFIQFTQSKTSQIFSLKAIPLYLQNNVILELVNNSAKVQFFPFITSLIDLILNYILLLEMPCTNLSDNTELHVKLILIKR